MVTAAQQRPSDVGTAASGAANRLMDDDMAALAAQYPGATLSPHIRDSLRIAAAVHSAAVTLGTSPDDLLALLELLPQAAPSVAVPSLTAEQERVLTAIGSPTPGPAAAGVLGPEQAAAAARWQLIRTGRTVAQVADALGVTPQRIRQRLHARTLLGVHHAGAWVLPAFQFTDDGHELPGWATVCGAVPADAPPIAVEHLLTHPSVDLPRDHEPVSPVQWLVTGGDPNPVAALVAGMLAVA
jgi:hypothetical protein